MRISELIEEITLLEGQQYDTRMLVGWLNEIEAQAFEQVIDLAEENEVCYAPYSEADDMERELLIPDRFRDVYLNYIRAKIDYMNQETERYNNDVTMFEASWKEYAAWHIRHHIPKRSARFRNY